MSKPRIVLGISDSHDAGVSLTIDGLLVAAVNEERLSRKKMAAGMPVASLEAIWRVANVRPEDVTCVGVAGKSNAGAAIPLNNDFSDDSGRYLASQRIAELIDHVPFGRQLLTSPTALAAYQQSKQMGLSLRVERFSEFLGRYGVRAPVLVFDHHDAHVASAYYTGDRPDALVVSNDGFGDGLCCKVALGDPTSYRFETISVNSFYNSLGTYYNYATLICGFPKSHHAGKTTGLAAFGDPAKTLPVFREMIGWSTADGAYINHGGVFRNCIDTLRRRLAGHSREDVAAGIQQHCEDVLTAMVGHYVERTGRRHVVLTGGVHANVKVNQRIAAIPGVESVFVFPNMGDGGLAAGAAFLAHVGQFDEAPLPRRLPHVYLGPDYSEADIAAAIEGFGLHAATPSNVAAEVARLLAAERVVARFGGAMEYGPRALGNRSILYAATKPEVNNWLNKQLRRTEFMPFAPVVRLEDASSYLQGYGPSTAYAAEFMTITYDVSDRCKREAPAIVHVDGTARPQVVKRDVNPGYYDILTEYNRITGLSVLVNTSFNMHEEPIVCSPRDAVRAFLDSNIDALVLGSFVVHREERVSSPRPGSCPRCRCAASRPGALQCAHHGG